MPIYGQRIPEEERFWRHVQKGSNEECWPWDGAPSEGYGTLRVFRNDKRRIIGAHKLSWELQNKKVVPPGLLVLHSCDNRICVNPNHLFIGTAADNTHDMMKKGRGSIGEKAGSSVLTRQDVSKIRLLFAEGVSGHVIAEQFGVAWSTVYRIRNGATWALVK